MKRLLIASILFLVPTLGYANSLELSVFTGYRWGGEFGADIEDRFNIFGPDLEVDDGEVFGATLDIPISENFYVELIYSQQDTTLRFDEGLLSPEVELFDLDLRFDHAGVLWQWNPGQVHPYFAVSAGLAQMEPDDIDLEEEDFFSASMAGGVKIFPSEHIGLRLEARTYWINIDSDDDDDFFEDRDNDDDLFQVEGTVGLVIRF